jgi:hypothetical protein
MIGKRIGTMNLQGNGTPSAYQPTSRSMKGAILTTGSNVGAVAAAPLLPTLDEESSQRKRLPHISLRPRNLSRTRHKDADMEMDSTARFLPTLQVRSRDIGKRKLTPFKDSDASEGDDELHRRSREGKLLQEAVTPTSGAANQVLSNQDGSACFSSSSEMRPAGSLSLSTSQDSKNLHVLKNGKRSFGVTPSPLLAFQAAGASSNPSITKPLPVRRLLFPAASTKRRKVSSSSSQTLVFSSGSAFQNA